MRLRLNRHAFLLGCAFLTALLQPVLAQTASPAPTPTAAPTLSNTGVSAPAAAPAPSSSAAVRPAPLAVVRPVPSAVPPVPAPVRTAPAPSPAPIATRPAAPARVVPPVSVPSKPLDYGGRDSIAGTIADTEGTGGMNPLAQAWKALEALVIVLALVVGAVYGLKRFGLIKTDGAASMPKTPRPGLLSFLEGRTPRTVAPPATSTTLPAADWITLVGSQPLPNANGACLHLVTLAGKTLLLGTTGQSVSLLTELDAEWETEPHAVPQAATPAAFSNALARADAEPVRVPNETELLMNATTMRLQAIIARSAAPAEAQKS